MYSRCRRDMWCVLLQVPFQLIKQAYDCFYVMPHNIHNFRSADCREGCLFVPAVDGCTPRAPPQTQILLCSLLQMCMSV